MAQIGQYPLWILLVFSITRILVYHNLPLLSTNNENQNNFKPISLTIIQEDGRHKMMCDAPSIWWIHKIHNIDKHKQGRKQTWYILATDLYNSCYHPGASSWHSLWSVYSLPMALCCECLAYFVHLGLNIDMHFPVIWAQCWNQSVLDGLSIQSDTSSGIMYSEAAWQWVLL